MYNWSSWRTLVPLILGVFGLISFTIYSINISTEPLICHTLFNSPTVIVAYIETVAQGLIVWSLLYYISLYFEVAKNYSPITSGVAIFLFTFTIALSAVIVGLIITRTGRYRPSLWIGWFLTTFGIGLLIFLHLSTNILS
jgi:hypothetical protein